MESQILLDLCPSFTTETAVYPETPQGCCKSMYDPDPSALHMACPRNMWYHSAGISLPCQAFGFQCHSRMTDCSTFAHLYLSGQHHSSTIRHLLCQVLAGCKSYEAVSASSLFYSTDCIPRARMSNYRGIYFVDGDNLFSKDHCSSTKGDGLN